MTPDPSQALAWLKALETGKYGGPTTPAPWKRDSGDQIIGPDGEPIHYCDCGQSTFDTDDAALIAHVRNVLPQLIGVVEAAQYALQWIDVSGYKSAKIAGYVSGPDLNDALTALADAIAREQEKG